MKKLLILGAGSSYGHGVRDVCRPPMIEGFFMHNLFSKLSPSYSPLFSYIYDITNLKIDNSTAINFEELYSRIEPIWRLKIFRGEKAISIDKYNKAFEFFSPLDFFCGYISDLIFNSTQWAFKNVCPFHMDIVTKWLQKNDIIISFNYDLIMDSALVNYSDWKEENGYGWQMKKNDSITGIRMGEQEPLDLLVSGDNTVFDSFVTLLKPHGSLNFKKKIYSRRKYKAKSDLKYFLNNHENRDDFSSIGWEDYKTVEIIPIQNFLDNYNCCIVPQFAQGMIDETVESKKLLRRLYPDYNFTTILPFIIMPTKYKPFEEMTYAELGIVWKQIFDAFIHVDEAVSCGFSFSDVHFNQLMREAIRLRDKKLRFTVIEPNHDKFISIKNILISDNIIIKHFNGTLQDFTKKL